MAASFDEITLNFPGVIPIGFFHAVHVGNPACIFDSGSVLPNQNVNGCIRTYVKQKRTVAERISKNHNGTVAKRISKIDSGFVQDWLRIRSGLVRLEQIILVQDWF